MLTYPPIYHAVDCMVGITAGANGQKAMTKKRFKDICMMYGLDPTQINWLNTCMKQMQDGLELPWNHFKVFDLTLHTITDTLRGK